MLRFKNRTGFHVVVLRSSFGVPRCWRYFCDAPGLKCGGCCMLLVIVIVMMVVAMPLYFFFVFFTFFPAVVSGIRKKGREKVFY